MSKFISLENYRLNTHSRSTALLGPQSGRLSGRIRRVQVHRWLRTSAWQTATIDVTSYRRDVFMDWRPPRLEIPSTNHSRWCYDKDVKGRAGTRREGGETGRGVSGEMMITTCEYKRVVSGRRRSMTATDRPFSQHTKR